MTRDGDSSRMANNDTPIDCPKWLERFDELRALCRLDDVEIEEITGISHWRISRYRKPKPEDRPIIRLAEAMAIARCFAAKMNGDLTPGEVLAYLADGDLEDGLPTKALGDAWRLKLRDGRELKAAEIINDRRIEAQQDKPAPPKRRSSRAEAKRKHLGG